MATDSLNIVRISSADQLEALILERRLPANIHAEFRLTHVAAEQAARWEASVNRLLQECGCSPAAKCATCATLAGASLGVRDVISGSLNWPVFSLYSCLFIVGAAVAAKFAALTIARVRLRRIVAELRELEMPAIPPTTMSSR